MEMHNLFLHKTPSSRWLTNGIHSLLSRADARGSADIIYSMTHIATSYRSGIVTDVKK